MKESIRESQSRGKPLLAAMGVIAFGALGILSSGHDTPQTGPRLEAGSGSAPTNTVYVQPVVGGMTVGATSAVSSPNSVPEVTRAVPAVKAK
jgi:hypothetical protein